MKKKILILLLIINVGCGENKHDYIQDSSGNYVLETEVDNSIIKRVVLDKSKKLSSVEYENTKSNEVKIYYYDSVGKLTQSLKFNTLNQRFIDNCVFNEGGVMIQKNVKNEKNEKLSVFSFDEMGKLIKKEFFREGDLSIKAFVSLNARGEVDNSYRKSHFLSLWRKGEILYIKPVGLKTDLFESAYINIMENFRDVNNVGTTKERIDYNKNSVLMLDLSRFNSKEELKCEVYILESKVSNIPNYQYYELYLKDIDSIPPDNLYPIIERTRF